MILFHPAARAYTGNHCSHFFDLPPHIVVQYPVPVCGSEVGILHCMSVDLLSEQLSSSEGAGMVLSLLLCHGLLCKGLCREGHGLRPSC